MCNIWEILYGGITFWCLLKDLITSLTHRHLWGETHGLHRTIGQLDFQCNRHSASVTLQRGNPAPLPSICYCTNKLIVDAANQRPALQLLPGPCDNTAAAAHVESSTGLCPTHHTHHSRYAPKGNPWSTRTSLPEFKRVTATSPCLLCGGTMKPSSKVFPLFLLHCIIF